jgi:AcrR family transcriptional regulator
VSTSLSTESRPLLPGRATADGTHRRLLEEALLLFGARGFHGVSVREITEATGIRASSLYAHMESKEQLLFELVMVGHEEHHDLLRQASLDASADPVDQLARLVRAHVFFHATYPLLARICNRELGALAPDSLARVNDVRNASTQMMFDVVERGMRLGVFHVDDVWLASAGPLAMGLRVAEWWSDELGYTVEQVADAYATFAVRLLSSERTAPPA